MKKQMTNADDLRYQEALRRYQVEVGEYEKAVTAYKAQLQTLKEDDVRPSRPIPPIPPMRSVKLEFAGEVPAGSSDVFNEGVETAALSLEMVGERELAAWVRRQKR
jgi:hypothetical protein